MIFNPGALPEAALRDLISQAIALQVRLRVQQQEQPEADVEAGSEVENE